MLPHQAPLYNAFDALDCNDLRLAEAEIERFFAALESDGIALECRRQHFDRQVFEADFVSTLIKEEIDAWWVLSAVKTQRCDWQGARADCYRQIELIDRHYGFDTPSWQRPETRIPRDQELADRYFRLAFQLTTICSKLGEDGMSERWSKISSSGLALSDRVNADEVWGRWIAEEGDDPEPVGLDSYHFPEWSIAQVEVDGTQWLANIYSMLPREASPRKYRTLVTVRVPTDPSCEVPAKAVRWRIWSLRQAIALRFKRWHVGIFFGELQRRGERVLLYYATDEEEVRLVTEAPLKAAEELSPRLEMRQDDSWNEYSSWSGSSIIAYEATAEVPGPTPQEHENDAFLREVWKQCQSISSVWSKMYALLWVVNLVPPRSAIMQKFFVDYFFGLIKLLSAQETDFALWHMVWKLPVFDAQAALRALDMIQLNCIADEDQCTANFAAEALADFAPERALAIVESLKKLGYTLIHKPAGKVAVSISRTDRGRGLALIEATRQYILDNCKQSFGRVSYLIDLADEIYESFAEAARALLLEANDMIAGIDERSTRAQVYLAILGVAKRAAPDLLPAICPGALKSAFALTAPPKHWMDFTGPSIAIEHICWVVPYVVLYNKVVALEVLAQATDMVLELDTVEQLEKLPSLAKAAAGLGVEMNLEFASRLWTILEKNSQEATSPGRSFMDTRRLPGNPGPVEAFVKMNSPLAAERIEAILAICAMPSLPEQQVDLLSSFAASMPDQMDCARRLIARAAGTCRNCSSAFLRASALARVAAVMHGLGLDANDICHEAIGTLESIASPQTRMGALLDAARQCCQEYPEFASHLLEIALATARQLEDLPDTLVGQLDGLPRHHSSKLFFELLQRRKDDRRLTEQLSRFAASFANETQ